MKTMELTIQHHKYQKVVMTYMFNWSLKPLYIQEKIWERVVPTSARPTFSPAGPSVRARPCGQQRGRGVSNVYQSSWEATELKVIVFTPLAKYRGKSFTYGSLISRANIGIDFPFLCIEAAYHIKALKSILVQLSSTQFFFLLIQ